MEKKVFAAVIYDAMNVIRAVEIRPTLQRAELAGHFFTRNSGWYKVVEGCDNIDMYVQLINA